MWIAKDIDGTIIAFENKPEINHNGFWYSNLFNK